MPLPVSLREVVGQMDGLPDDWRLVVNRVTGEILMLPNESGEVEDLDREDRARVEASDDFIDLPGKFEIHEYRIMQTFVEQEASGKVQAALSKAIEGRGVFRRFKDRAHDLGVIEEWYRYKDRQIGDLAATFLAAEGISFRDDLAKPPDVKG